MAIPMHDDAGVQGALNRHLLHVAINQYHVITWNLTVLLMNKLFRDKTD